MSESRVRPEHRLVEEGPATERGPLERRLVEEGLLQSHPGQYRLVEDRTAQADPAPFGLPDRRHDLVQQLGRERRPREVDRRARRQCGQERGPLGVGHVGQALLVPRELDSGAADRILRRRPGAAAHPGQSRPRPAALLRRGGDRPPQFLDGTLVEPAAPGLRFRTRPERDESVFPGGTQRYGDPVAHGVGHGEVHGRIDEARRLAQLGVQERVADEPGGLRHRATDEPQASVRHLTDGDRDRDRRIRVPGHNGLQSGQHAAHVLHRRRAVQHHQQIRRSLAPAPSVTTPSMPARRMIAVRDSLMSCANSGSI